MITSGAEIFVHSPLIEPLLMAEMFNMFSFDI